MTNSSYQHDGKIKKDQPSRRRQAHQGSGQGRAHAAGSRYRTPRSGLLPGRCAEGFGRRIRFAASALQCDRKAISRICYGRLAVAEDRRGAVGQIQEGPPRGADAVARQRLCRGGRARFRRPYPALPQARRRRPHRLQRRAEDRRAVDVAALRRRRTRHRRHPRRRRRGRGRHRQYPHAGRRSAES